MSNFKSGVKHLAPGYFALVMATGIISTGFQLLHFDLLGKVFFMLNNVQYCILVLLFIVRVILFFPQIKADLATHSKGAGFLTIVAGSAILGTGYVQGHQMFATGSIFLTIAILAWVLIVYAFLSSVILQLQKPTLETGINGSWLLLIVSIQSLVILLSSLASHFGISISISLFVAMAAWLCGIILYTFFVTIIIYRLMFYPVKAKEVSPSYWIDTGAAAITTVAGAALSNAIQLVPLYQNYLPCIHLFCLLFWAIAAFWLPLLVILETWRHFKAGFSYSAGYWSMVFPLGMFSVATLRLSNLLQAPFITPISQVFIFVALALWLVVFAGMCKGLFSMLIVKRQDEE